MTFRRSNSGLKNQALFYGKRYVVYVEEHQQLDPGRSVDVSFWRSFFNHHYSPNIFEYKPLGGKEHVKKIAEDVIRDAIPNCLFAMDRDYDDLFGSAILDDRVFYTFGYGVENDLFDLPVVAQVVKSILPGHNKLDRFSKEVLLAIEDFVVRERYLFITDQIAASRSSSTIDRNKPQSNIDVDASPIRLRREIILDRFKKCANSPSTRKNVKEFRATRNMIPCHVYFEVVYHQVVALISSYTTVKVSKDSFRQLAITVLSLSFSTGLSDEVAQYYSSLSKRNIDGFSSQPDVA